MSFLQAGPVPVFIGFGSMAPGQGERLSELTAAAAARAGVRAVIQAGWAGLAPRGADLLDRRPAGWPLAGHDTAKRWWVRARTMPNASMSTIPATSDRVHRRRPVAVRANQWPASASSSP